MDLEFTEDKIHNHLFDKLQALQLQNRDAEAVLTERRRRLNESTVHAHVDLRIENYMKGFYSNKFYIQFDVVGCGVFKVSQVLLDSNSEEQVPYIVSCFSRSVKEVLCNDSLCEGIICNSLKWSNIFSKRGFVVIIFSLKEMPVQPTIELYGRLICKVKDDSVDIAIAPFHITPHEQQLAQNIKQQEFCSSSHLLALISLGRMFDFFVIVPDRHSITLDDLFEVQCSMVKVSFSNNTHYFVLKDLENLLLNNVLVFVHSLKGYNGIAGLIKVCVPSGGCSYAFMSYFHSRVPLGVSLLLRTHCDAVPNLILSK